MTEPHQPEAGAAAGSWNVHHRQPDDYLRPDSLLVHTLPGISRETLADVLIGAVSRQADCPKTALDSLRCLLAHAGYHSDRVWASNERIAELVRKLGNETGGQTRTISARTVQRAMAYWCETFPVLRRISGDELLEGPGEHDYVVAGHEKRGDGPVNHYDISGLRRFVPEELVRVFDAVIIGGEIRAAPILPPEPARDLNELFGDPFAEPSATSPAFPTAPPISETQHPSAVPATTCNVRDREAEGAKIRPATGHGLQKFDVTKMSAITTRNAREGTAITRRGRPPMEPGQTARELRRLAVYRTLRNWPKANEPGILVLLREAVPLRGESWVEELIDYARWRQLQTGETLGIGWMLQVSRGFDDKAGWPDPFAAHLDRQRAAKARDIDAGRQAHNAAARRTVKPPPKVEAVASSAEMIERLGMLPDAVLVLLEAQARAALLANGGAYRRMLEHWPDWRHTPAVKLREEMVRLLIEQPGAASGVTS